MSWIKEERALPEATTTYSPVGLSVCADQDSVSTHRLRRPTRDQEDMTVRVCEHDPRTERFACQRDWIELSVIIARDGARA